MKDTPKEVPESGPATNNVADEILEFCNEAFNYLETMRDLYDALDHQYDRFENQGAKEETGEPSDAALANEIRVARTMMGLIAEKAKKLNRRASCGQGNLERMLQALRGRTGIGTAHRL